MAFPNPATAENLARTRGLTGSFDNNTRSLNSAVSWGAIAAGAAAAASLSLILLILGVGLGLSSVSPWARNGVSATTFGVSTILWLTLTQLLASAMGGYLAGRLRTKWTEVHADEVYFRDTAHGFLAWAIASLSTAALLTSVIRSILSGGVQAGALMGPARCRKPPTASLMRPTLAVDARAKPFDRLTRIGDGRAAGRVLAARHGANTGGQTGARGKRIVDTVPAAVEDSTVIVPPCASTISRTMNRPSPRLVLERSCISELAFGA